MSLLCLLGHRWSRWSDVTPVWDGSRIRYMQYRYCRRCRIADEREMQ